MVYAVFAGVVILQSVAQILEKHGMSQVGNMSLSLATLARIVTNPFVVAGVALSAIGLVAWLILLTKVNVSYIYPFGAVSYIVVGILAAVFLKESLLPVQWAGIGAIVVGAVLLNIR